MPRLPALKGSLTGGVVTLRRFTVDDVAAVTAACQDPEIARWTAGIPSPYEERHAREWIALHDRFWNEDGRATFAFCDVARDELLGSMALGEVDQTARRAIAGSWAAPWARNRGATTRVLVLVCRWGARGARPRDGRTPPRALDPNAHHEVRHWVWTSAL